MDTPLKALFQCLRYCAIIDANRTTLALEVERFGVDLKWPAVLAVAADTAYWKELRENQSVGDWRDALRALADSLLVSLGAEVHLLDLGTIRAEICADGKAYLRDPAVVREV